MSVAVGNRRNHSFPRQKPQCEATVITVLAASVSSLVMSSFQTFGKTTPASKVTWDQVLILSNILPNPFLKQCGAESQKLVVLFLFPDLF